MNQLDGTINVCMSYICFLSAVFQIFCPCPGLCLNSDIGLWGSDWIAVTWHIWAGEINHMKEPKRQIGKGKLFLESNCALWVVLFISMYLLLLINCSSRWFFHLFLISSQFQYYTILLYFSLLPAHQLSSASALTLIITLCKYLT